jgi:ribose transport system permease protein
MKRDRWRLNLGLDRFSGLYIWALIIIIFSIWQPGLFPTKATVDSVASEQAVTAILGLAVLVPLAAGIYDLSVGSTINLSCILVTELMTSSHWGMVPAIVASVLVGIFIGAVNGLLVVRLHIDSFIATLGTATVIAAVQTIVSGNNQPIPASGNAWSDFTQTSVLGFQIVFLYLLVIAVVLWWVLQRTPVGRYLFAVGGNREAARLSGVRVSRYTWLSLIVSGGLSGVGGVLYASQLGPSLTFGQGMLLPAFAAAFLGSTQLKPGRFNVWGTLLAVYVLATGVKGLQLVTGVQWLNDMFNGVALVGAVGFAVWRQRAAARRRLTDPVTETGAAGTPSGGGMSQGAGEGAKPTTTGSNPDGAKARAVQA